MCFWAPEKLHFSWKSGPKYVWIMIQKYNGCVYNPTTLSDIKNRILQLTTNFSNDSPEWKIIAVIGNINHMKSVFLMALSIRISWWFDSYIHSDRHLTFHVVLNQTAFSFMVYLEHWSLQLLIKNMMGWWFCDLYTLLILSGCISYDIKQAIWLDCRYW